MTEKEFIEKAIWGICLNANYVPSRIDEFLEQHHKEYCEVEFVRIEDLDEAMTKIIKAWSPTLAENITYRHLPECGTKYRGCAPECPKEKAEVK